MTEGFSRQIETSKAFHSKVDIRLACRSEMSERLCKCANGARAAMFINLNGGGTLAQGDLACDINYLKSSREIFADANLSP